jgi:uncharacterized protein YukE
MGRISMPQGKGSLMHNRREYEMYGKELPSHIHKDHIQENIVSEVDIKQMYQNLFGQAVEEYNSKQKRKDRKIKDYYEQIKKSKNGEKLFYEDVVQWGSKEDFEKHPELREVAKQCLIEYANSFMKENPRLRVIGAYIHMDEASPHLHIDYIPVAIGYKKGMSRRNSLDKAMKQMGFIPEGKEGKHNNATMLWKDKERNRFKNICLSHGLEVEEEKQWNRKSLSVDEYKDAKDKMRSDLQEEHKELIQNNQKMEQMVDENVGKIYDQLGEIENLKTQKADLTEINQQLQEENKTLHDSTVEQLSQIIRSQENEMETLQNNIEELKTEFGFMDSQVEQLKKEKYSLEELQNTASELEKSVSSLKSKNNELKQDNSELELKLTSRRQSLSEHEEKIEELEPKVEQLQSDYQNLLELTDMMNREIELLDKKRVWKDYREMTSSERSHYFHTPGMTVEYSNGTKAVIHYYGNEHLEGMRNGTLRMGVYMPEEMVLVPKSVVKELIDTHDQQYSLTKDTRLFVNMFNKLRGALSRIKERKNDDLER